MVVEDDLDSLPHSEGPLRGSFASRFLAAVSAEPLSARRSRSGSKWVFRHECGRPEGLELGFSFWGTGFGLERRVGGVYPFRDGSPGGLRGFD